MGRDRAWRRGAVWATVDDCGSGTPEAKPPSAHRPYNGEHEFASLNEEVNKRGLSQIAQEVEPRFWGQRTQNASVSICGITLGHGVILLAAQASHNSK